MRRRRSGSSEGAPARRRRRRGGGAASRAPAPVAESAPRSETDDAETVRVVDPTHVLLSRVGPVQSRVPWVAVGIAVVVALWVPLFTSLATAPVRPAESRWVEDALAPPGQHSAGSAFALRLAQSNVACAGTSPCRSANGIILSRTSWFQTRS